LDPPVPLNVVFARDLVALLHAFPAREAFFGARFFIEIPSAATREGGVAGRAVSGTADIHTCLGICLGTIIWREDLDGVINA